MKKLFYIFIFCFSFGITFSTYKTYHFAPPLKKATIYVHPKYQENNVFDMEKGIYNYRYIFPELKKLFLKYGYELATQDIHPMNESDLILIAWPYAPKPPIEKKDVSYLWLFESPIGIKTLTNSKTEKHFNKIFTYNTQLADGQKYIHLYDPYQFDDWGLTDEDIGKKDLFVIQIASNLNYHPKYNTLYEERRVATKWFLENYPEDYILYGRGYWKTFREKLPEKLKSVFDERYKGVVENKKELVKQARFILVYENIRVDDYVSEKIYDAINAGTIPVYLGAKNIRAYVPEKCFIDKEKYPTYEALYAYLKNMPEDEYREYIKCMKEFVSPQNKNRVQDIDKAVKTIEQTIFQKTWIDRVKEWILD